jgi:predicted dehydrogenase
MGGGPVLTFSHELDAVCWLFGAPRAVTAVAHRSGSLEVDTEDVAEMVLEFEDGPLASVHVDYLRRPPRRFIEVVGEDGLLRWEFHAHRLLRYVPSTREWRVEEGDPRFERNLMFVHELQDFVGKTGSRASIGATGEQGAAVLAIALAALRSAAQEQRVDLACEPPQVQTWLKTL